MMRLDEFLNRTSGKQYFVLAYFTDMCALGYLEAGEITWAKDVNENNLTEMYAFNENEQYHVMIEAGLITAEGGDDAAMDDFDSEEGGEEAPADETSEGGDGDGQKNDPESRFFVVHHRFYTLLYPDLAEGERAGRNSAAVHTARDKGLHIVGPLPTVQMFDHFFVACQLDIPAPSTSRWPAVPSCR